MMYFSLRTADKILIISIDSHPPPHSLNMNSVSIPRSRKAKGKSQVSNQMQIFDQTVTTASESNRRALPTTF